jgi:hypothetical protein
MVSWPPAALRPPPSCGIARCREGLHPLSAPRPQPPPPPRSGVFVCGAAPLWLFASRGRLVAHPLAAGDAPVAAMTAFHNVNAPHGFILAAPTGDLRVCHLPAQVRGGSAKRGVPCALTAF